MSDELNLSITGVEPQIEIAGARRVLLATTRGKIRMTRWNASSRLPCPFIRLVESNSKSLARKK
jgi:hypothetical protein